MAFILACIICFVIGYGVCAMFAVRNYKEGMMQAAVDITQEVDSWHGLDMKNIEHRNRIKSQILRIGRNDWSKLG